MRRTKEEQTNRILKDDKRVIGSTPDSFFRTVECIGNLAREQTQAFPVICHVDTAAAHDVEFVRENIRKSNPKATILETACRVSVPNPSRDAVRWRWKSVPTLTHEILTALTARRKSLPRKVTKK